ncbi:MAG: hypothetical protein N3A66_01660, partial [Planctomycetota bacterium]|nr:hypothetical protein [Planctomycetota bacterium]
MMAGKEIRLARLFNRDENAVIVAADHGEFAGPIPGLINIDKTLSQIYNGVDGILLSPGFAPRAAALCGRRAAPCLVIRLNWASHFCSPWGYEQAASSRAASAAEA